MTQATAVIDDPLGTGREVVDDDVHIDVVAPVGVVDDSGRRDVLEHVHEGRIVHERDEVGFGGGQGSALEIEQRELGALVAAGVVLDDDPPRRPAGGRGQVAPDARAGQPGELPTGAVGGDLDELRAAVLVMAGENPPVVVEIVGGPGADLEQAGHDVVHWGTGAHPPDLSRALGHRPLLHRDDRAAAISGFGGLPDPHM